MSDRTCSIEGCCKPVKSRGWCTMHAARFYRHGDPLAQMWQGYPDVCKIERCGRKCYARGWCNRHYLKWRTHGTPTGGQDKFFDPAESFAARAARDTRTGCLVWTGSLSIGGYGRMRVGNEHIAAHRYAWERVNGAIPEGMAIDHVCFNRACVEVLHLRLATTAQNNWHRPGPARNSRTGVRNVHVRGNRYEVKVRKNGEVHYGGRFDTVAEAAPVAEQLRRELFGKFAGKG